MKNKKKILFIVEGAETEVNFLGSIGHSLLHLNDGDYKIISYNTSIYELYTAYKEGEYDYIIDYLVSEKNLEIDRNLKPSEAFSAIYLMFDFDFNYQKYSDEVILDLMQIFNNETENGKLYINYPMFESFYHICNFPDYNYKYSTIENSDCYSIPYKALVNKETCIKKSKRINKLTLFHIINHNYDKAKYICGNVNNDELEIDYRLILEKQINKKNNEYCIYILNTFVLFIIDYNPALINVIKNKI